MVPVDFLERPGVPALSPANEPELGQVDHRFSRRCWHGLGGLLSGFPSRAVARGAVFSPKTARGGKGLEPGGMFGPTPASRMNPLNRIVRLPRREGKTEEGRPNT
jgi:hypothetical protein